MTDQIELAELKPISTSDFDTPFSLENIEKIFESGTAYTQNKQLKGLCDLSDNDDTVSYILSNIKTDLDLKTNRMFLKFIKSIKEFYAAKGQVLSKQKLANIIQFILINPKIRQSFIQYYGSEHQNQHKLLTQPINRVSLPSNESNSKHID